MAKIQEILTTRIGDFIQQFNYKPNVIFLNEEDYVRLVDEGDRMGMIPHVRLRPTIQIETFRGLAVKKSEESCIALALNLEMAKVDTT